MNDNATHDEELARRLTELYARADASLAARPSFRVTLDAAARRRNETVATPRGWLLAGAAASVAVVGLVVWIARGDRQPTLDDDIRLAQTVSYDSIWRAPSDRLFADSGDPLLNGLPNTPRAGNPDLAAPFSKEYL